MNTRQHNKGYHDEEDDIGTFWTIVGVVSFILLFIGFCIGHWVFPKH